MVSIDNLLLDPENPGALVTVMSLLHSPSPRNAQNFKLSDINSSNLSAAAHCS
jgi:hypothetical protein